MMYENEVPVQYTVSKDLEHNAGNVTAKPRNINQKAV